MIQSKKLAIRWGIIIASLIIVSAILWNTYQFFQRYKEEERRKMEIIAAAYESFNNPDLDADMNLVNQVLNGNHDIPMILTDETGVISIYRHLDSIKALENTFLEKQLAIMKAQNEPLLFQFGDTKQYIYYKDSKTLTNLKYYPLALILILVLFSVVIYLFTKTNKIAAQNQLWTGMARETAHQIGTPLSSLLGWIAILRDDDEKSYIADEIEKDVQRLEVIAGRFSKIGSKTPLKTLNIVTLAKNSFDYLESRSSKKIDFSFTSESDRIEAPANSELFGWVIENLVKNAIDTMQGKGAIKLAISQNKQQVVLKITDTGKGIAKNLFNQIFEPGYTTKKRGWGIGLSLSKRIVENFHHGKIYVQQSELGKGTTFCVKIPKDLQ
ncbi:MAG TPA: HAMP domain-containing histidine kinase [Lutibacter sp.]|nr:HAMP domain-containing histidine kinase [Lutibacter sp.]